MRLQVSIDALVTSAGILAVTVVLLGAYYGFYSAVEKGVRLIHLKYLSTVIKDRMEICKYVDGAKVYAPYTVEVDCKKGELCYEDLCVDVECRGGGRGRTFLVKECRLTPA